MAGTRRAGTIDPAAVPYADCIVNLAGSSVADGKWTAERKHRYSALAPRRAGAAAPSWPSPATTCRRCYRPRPLAFMATGATRFCTKTRLPRPQPMTFWPTW
ncbi:MAG: hypothetical protein WKG07_48870 [Hymenobacter sp.]